MYILYFRRVRTALKALGDISVVLGNSARMLLMSSMYVSFLNEFQDKMSLLLSVEQARMTRVMGVLLAFALDIISHLCGLD